MYTRSCTDLRAFSNNIPIDLDRFWNFELPLAEFSETDLRDKGHVFLHIKAYIYTNFVIVIDKCNIKYKVTANGSIVCLNADLIKQHL